MDREGIRRAVDRAARLIAEWSGGSVSDGVVTAPGAAAPGSEDVLLAPARTNRLLGTDISAQEMQEYLRPKLERWPEKPVLVTAEEDSPYGAFIEAYDALRRSERGLQKAGVIQRMKIQILSLSEINRLKAQFGEDIFK